MMEAAGADAQKVSRTQLDQVVVVSRPAAWLEALAHCTSPASFDLLYRTIITIKLLHIKFTISISYNVQLKL